MKSKLFLIVTIFTLLSFPNVSFGQLPDLGSASGFVLFTTTGAVGSTGISQISGDVGSNDGAITGFGTANGDIYNADSVTALVSADVLIAYNQLKSRVPNFFPSPVLGDGQILTEGVYYIPQAASLNADLTLDAHDNPNAVFIFQIQGAFSTSASSTVTLINGASADNVFWVAEGAISMVAGTIMKGTLIAHPGAISLGAGCILEGRALSTTGAVAVYGTQAYVSLSPFALSTGLLSFTGACDHQNTVLRWNTTTETNTKYFTVERSAEGMKWQVVGKVEAAGSSSLKHAYALTDRLVAEEVSYYYRLKQTNDNGNYKYGNVVSIKKCGGTPAENLTLYPNPSVGKFDLLFTGDKTQVYSTEIFDTRGEKVYESIGYHSKFDLSGKTPGVYFVAVRLQSKTINRIVIVKK